MQKIVRIYEGTFIYDSDEMSIDEDKFRDIFKFLDYGERIRLTIELLEVK